MTVHTTPGGPVKTVLSSPDTKEAPVTFLVKQVQHDWMSVALPTRPNGSTGWVPRADVTLLENAYRLQVSLRSHRLTMFEEGKPVLQAPIAIGAPGTRTPTGNFYITEILRQPDPNGMYGPYAYGISAHSDTVTDFNGGDGQVGIHGTNDPAGIGHDISHGCVRLHNRDLLALVAKLPLGTPVDIVDPVPEPAKPVRTKTGAHRRSPSTKSQAIRAQR